MMRASARSDLAERILGGPVLWIGLMALVAFAMGPFCVGGPDLAQDPPGALRHAAAIPAAAP